MISAQRMCAVCSAVLTAEFCRYCGAPANGPVPQSLPPANRGSSRSLIVASTSAIPIGGQIQVNCVIDITGSMEEVTEQGIRKIDELYTALMSMRAPLLPVNNKIQIEIIEFNLTARIAIPFASPQEVFDQYVKPTPNGGTDLSKGMELARSELQCVSQGGEQVVVAMTDGETINEENALSAARQLHANGVQVITVCFGTTSHALLLKQMASTPELFFTSNHGELGLFFQRLAKASAASARNPNARVSDFMTR